VVDKWFKRSETRSVDLHGTAQHRLNETKNPGRRKVMAHILIVEDNDPVRWALTALLRSRGHVVDQTANGLQALAQFANRSFDIVLMDVYTPSMDGFEACRQIRQKSRVPILMLSTFSDPSLQERARACGANALLPKPLNVDGLLSWIGDAIANGGTRAYASPAGA
jgi:CheY-like chemotaxis protein